MTNKNVKIKMNFESPVKTRFTYRKSGFNMRKRSLKNTYDAGVRIVYLNEEDR